MFLAATTAALFAVHWLLGDAWYTTLLIAGLVGMTLLVPTVALVARARDRRVVPGRCVRCGFDLSGVPAGHCPECGYRPIWR